jgi:hypothetical protein
MITQLNSVSSAQSSNFAAPVKSNVANDDEAAAMAAMFQAQSANWEEAQEKMSQLVGCTFVLAPNLYNRRISC